MGQPSPSVQGGGLNMGQPSPIVQGEGLNMVQPSPGVQGGGLNMCNPGFLEHQIVGTVVRDGTEYTDINDSGTMQSIVNRQSSSLNKWLLKHFKPRKLNLINYFLFGKKWIKHLCI